MRIRVVFTTACAFASLAIGPSLAQEAEPAEDGRLSKLSVHGFLSQAYAKTDGVTLFGIPEEGTTDYRTAALQFRYAMTSDDDFVVQFNHLRLGRSVFQPVIPDVDVDWIFYQHRFSDRLALRAGKILIPLGVYNEVRDVGTLLPFYAPPDAVYPYVGFVPETVTGLAVAGRLGSGPWSLDADLYGGEWEFLQLQPTDFTANARKGVGAQVWLNTPVSGLRFGVRGNRADLAEAVTALPGTILDFTQLMVSAEGKLGPVKLVAEHLETKIGGSDYSGYYGQLSWSATDKLGVHLRHSHANFLLDLRQRPNGFVIDLPFTRENALSLSYAFQPNVVAKVEYHQFEGYSYAGEIPLTGRPGEVNYGIASVSTSF